MSAGAAHGDGEIAALFALKRRQPFLEERANVLEHSLHLRMLLQEPDHRLVEPGEPAQLGLPIRVREAADVEHKIRVKRCTVLEAERLKQQHKSGRIATAGQIMQLLAQFHRFGVRRVDPYRGFEG